MAEHFRKLVIVVDRYEILSDLVFFRRPIADLSKELAQFDWDYDGESIMVQSSHVEVVLEGFIANKFNARDLEGWANLIEGREDLDYEDSKREELEEVIDALANPILQGEITKQSCEYYLNQLKS